MNWIWFDLKMWLLTNLIVIIVYMYKYNYI